VIFRIRGDIPILTERRGRLATVGLKEVGTLKTVTAIIGMMIVSLLCASPTVASESWTCIKMAAGKALPFKYVVNGKLLIHADGSAYSKILLNDERLLISFGSFVSNVHRYPKNSHPVEIDEPFVTYFILDKLRNRLLMLDNGAMVIFSDMHGNLPDASLEELPCTRD